MAQGVEASRAVRSEYAKITGSEADPEEEAGPSSGVERKPLEACNICYDDFEAGDATVFCETSCGGNFHAACMKLWLNHKRKVPGDPPPFNTLQSQTVSTPPLMKGTG